MSDIFSSVHWYWARGSSWCHWGWDGCQVVGWDGGQGSSPPFVSSPLSVSDPPFGYLMNFKSDLEVVKWKVSLLNK